MPGGRFQVGMRAAQAVSQSASVAGMRIPGQRVADAHVCEDRTTVVWAWSPGGLTVPGHGGMARAAAVPGEAPSVARKPMVSHIRTS
ncbi:MULTISPECIES: hypothetical protein [unclassified Nonomuraea]